MIFTATGVASVALPGASIKAIQYLPVAFYFFRLLLFTSCVTCGRDPPSLSWLSDKPPMLQRTDPPLPTPYPNPSQLKHLAGPTRHRVQVNDAFVSPQKGNPNTP